MRKTDTLSSPGREFINAVTYFRMDGIEFIDRRGRRARRVRRDFRFTLVATMSRILQHLKAIILPRNDNDKVNGIPRIS